MAFRSRDAAPDPNDEDDDDDESTNFRSDGKELKDGLMVSK